MRCIVVMTVFSIGCPTPTPPRPKTHVRMIVQGASSNADLVASCNVWGSYLGLSCGFESSDQVECNRAWRHEGQICQLTLGLRFETGLAKSIGHRAESDRDLRLARFDASLLAGPRLDLQIAVAHELGHLILDTAEHTTTGVMAGTDVMLSAEDRALVQRSK